MEKGSCWVVRDIGVPDFLVEFLEESYSHVISQRKRSLDRILECLK
jgi:hypothetical protein